MGVAPSPVFLILAASVSAGRKSAGAAAITTASADAGCRHHGIAELLGGLDPHHLHAGRVGQAHVGRDQGHVGTTGDGGAGQRHALQTGRAVAEEAHRVQRLAGAAGGDDDAAAGQVARRRPSGEHVDGRRRRSRRARAAGPCRCRRRSAGPTAGSRTSAPRSRRVATLAWVAGCSHISVCIAGAKTTGQRAVSRVLVSRSSARPWAARASRSAVAGATTTRSAAWPIRTCGTSWASVQTSVETGLPDSAAQVAAPTNSSAACGRYDGHVVAGLGEQAQQLAGLVGRDAAGHPENDGWPTPRLGGGVGAGQVARHRVGVEPWVSRSGSPARGRRPCGPPPRRRALPGRRPHRSAGRR